MGDYYGYPLGMWKAEDDDLADGVAKGNYFPDQSKHGAKVVKVDWEEGSVVSPPTGWFHQHFNTGREQARQLAFRYSGQSGKYLLGIAKHLNIEGVRTSTRDSGTLIEYEDEDPQIRRDYEAALKKAGVSMQMPEVVYNEE